MYNPFSLKGKTILVTGASSGIGRATAIECSKMGASLVLVARNEERLNETLSRLDVSEGQQHQMFLADLSTEENIKGLVAKLPQLDGVASNAGFAIGNVPIKFIKDENLQKVFDVNTFGHVHLAKLLFKKKVLNKNASYVFTASIGGNYSFGPGNTIYGMSKAAVNSFMKFCAIEFASRGIRCNSVCPGMIETPLTQPGTFTQEDYEKDAEKYLLKRYGHPEEVARTIVFLLSDASSFIDGTSIIIDGGLTANH